MAFSASTVGAPIMAMGTTRASSGTSAGSNSVTGPHSWHGADGHQLAYIRSTAAAGAQQRRASGNIFDLRDSDFSHDFFLLSL